MSLFNFHLDSLASYPLQLILASESSARKRLLENAGIFFETCPSHCNETSLKQKALQDGLSARETALRLAQTKALSVSEKIAGEGSVIIGADQILSCQGQWYDKPVNREQAYQQIIALRGKTHVLHTAVVLVYKKDVIWQHVEEPYLHMRFVTEEFITQYLADEGDACLASVGAYRLEGRGIQLFECIKGDSFSIQGLPLLPLLSALREIKILQT
ncbi:MAG: septum formation protein Maf [Acetobacter sp.]|nr:septum formation protein Maf [Acetobacter sp.]